MRRAAALAALALALLAAAPAAIAATAARADLIDIEDEVMCVTCKIPLNVAEGPQPDREREFIRGLIAEGRTKAQIKSALVETYGANVLALPGDDGVGLTAYAIPLVLLALLGGGVAVLISRWRRAAAPPSSTGDAAPQLSDEDAERLEADLRRYEVTSSRAR